MSRLLLIAVIFLGLGYSLYINHQKQGAEAAREAALEQRMTNAVAAMASRANANTDWAARLAGHGIVRLSPIMSAELQKVWTPDRPILFVGSIRDIAKNEDGSFQLKISYDPWGRIGGYIFPATDLRVNLRCPESVAAPLLSHLKSRRRADIRSDAAAIAIIESIVMSEQDADGSETVVLTGIGNCSNALLLEDY